MDNLTQLASALLGAIFLFVAAYSLPPRYSLGVLVLLTPFQLIDSRYGSANTMLIYIVGAAFLLRGRLRNFPLLLGFAIVLLAYLMSVSQALRPTMFDHATYLIALGGNIIFFYLIYNFVTLQERWQSIWGLLLVLNVLVLIYCGIQLSVGFNRVAVLGISEFELLASRQDDRLVGPFNATAMTAEYLVVQTLLIAYTLSHERFRKFRLPCLALLFANMFFLVTTGNRGGVIILVLGAIGYLFLFRRNLGTGRTLAAVAVISLAFAVMATVAVRYTDFNVLFQRLQSTEVEGLVPDSRRSWPEALSRGMEKPIFGHGPRLRLIEEHNRRIREHKPMFYPHSAPLYLLYTVGAIGLTAWMVFVLMLTMRLARSARSRVEDPFLNGLPRLGLLIVTVVVASELRMEMFRFSLFDYQNYLFALLGAFVGFADRVHAERPAARRVAEPLVMTHSPSPQPTT